MILVCLSVAFYDKMLDYLEEKFRMFNEFIKQNPTFNYVLCVITAIITVITIQMMVLTSWRAMGVMNFLMNILVVLCVELVLIFVTGNIKCSVIISMLFFAGIGIVNAYVYSFRSVMLSPLDFKSIKTAMNVAGNYSLFPIPNGLSVGALLIIASMFIVLLLKVRGEDRKQGFKNIDNHCLLYRHWYSDELH